jgi:Cu2+-exporting ATPase
METISDNTTQKSMIMEHNHNSDSHCCGMSHHNVKNETSSENNSAYFCPMKCEGEKTYPQPGNCPVCNMHLVPVKK